MSRSLVPPTARIAAPRRRFIVAAAGTLSAGAIALLAPRSGLVHAAAGDAAGPGDAQILGTALAAEHQAVAAYGVGLGSGLLGAGASKLATQFRDHHRAHADALIAALKSLGAEAAGPLAKYAFPVETLKAERDVLAFAAGLERGAISAYVGAVPLFADRELSRAAASILADESMHWAVLRNALGLDPVPEAFFS